MEWNAEEEIVIVGAGISGLACAQFLRQRGADPLVLEAGSRAGGKLWSEESEGFLLEHGPASLRGSSDALRELVDALGLRDRLVEPSPEASRRFILRGGVPQPVPSGIGDFWKTELISGKAKLRVLAEPFVRRRRGPAAAAVAESSGSPAAATPGRRPVGTGKSGSPPQAAAQERAAGHSAWAAADGAPSPGAGDRAEESVTEFVTRRLGREINDYAVEPFVAGIFAGDPDRLSVQSAFPMLYGLERRHGSLLRGALRMRKAREHRPAGGSERRPSSGQLTFRGGVAELTDTIADRLAERLLLEACVTRIAQADGGYELQLQYGKRERRLRARRVVLAVPAPAAAEVIRDLAPGASEALSAIPYPPVLTVNAGYPNSALTEPLSGFGMLVPRVERRRILGVIYASSVLPHRGPPDHALFTIFVGGSRDAELLRSEPEERLIRRTLAETQALLGIRGDPTLLRHTLWERAIPQYTLGHQRRISAVAEAEAQHPGLNFIGNYRGGVAIANCLTEARRLAGTLAG